MTLLQFAVSKLLPLQVSVKNIVPLQIPSKKWLFSSPHPHFNFFHFLKCLTCFYGGTSDVTMRSSHVGSPVTLFAMQNVIKLRQLENINRNMRRG